MKDEFGETVSLEDKGWGGENRSEDEGEEGSKGTHEAGEVPWGPRLQGERGDLVTGSQGASGKWSSVLGG